MCGISIAQGLSELHAQHITHGGLKPSNVLRTDSGYHVLVDYRLSEIVKRTIRPNLLDGPLNYMAPEQIDGNTEGKAVTCTADMWALGCIMIHMLTGKPPLEDCSSSQIIKMVRP